jgi:hypothetical protein
MNEPLHQGDRSALSYQTRRPDRAGLAPLDAIVMALLLLLVLLGVLIVLTGIFLR